MHIKTTVVRLVGLIMATCLLSLAGSVAWAARPSAPSVTTGSATTVQSTTATLNGTAHAATAVWFQYGTGTSYGSSTQLQTPGAGGAFQATISGLAPGTTYHFQAVAKNSNGTTYGGDQTFTTPRRSPSVSTVGATMPQQGVVRLTGAANPQGSSTTVRFQYGTTSSYTLSTAATSIGSGTSSVAFHADLNGLEPGKTYHYRAVATNQSGTSYGADLTATAGGAPAVTTVGATAITAISATLSGIVNPAGTTTTVSFEYGTTTSYGSTAGSRNIGSGSAAVAFHEDITDLKPGVTYHYRAVARTAKGDIYGGDKTFTTTKKPTLTTTQAAAVSDTTATLTGMVDPAGSTTTVDFQYGTSTDYGRLTAPQRIGGGIDPVPFEAKLTGLQPGTTYHFRAIGTSIGGSGMGEDLTFTTTGTSPTASAQPSAAPSISAPVSTAHHKPTGFNPVLFAGGIALGALILGGLAVLALARGRR